MGHVRVLTSDGVGFHLVAVFVLIPASLNEDFLLVAVEIAEAVEVNEHAVGIGGDVVTLPVGKAIL